MSKVKLIRNKDTGEMEAFKDGKKIGKVITMGDEVKDKKNDSK